jgi:7-cyano-7-deazaguanine reductase
MARSPRSNTLGSTRKTPATAPSRPSRRLDTFSNPSRGRDYVIQFVIPEFTCNCPLTGQPDFAHFTIDMIADALCVELKSLKLYFWSYRDVGSFHEEVTNTIVDDIVAATKPRFVRIVARWNVRGGITTTVIAEYRKNGWSAAAPVVLPLDAASSMRP